MSKRSSTNSNLQRVFEQSFVTLDLCEPLISFDETSSANEVRKMMESRRLEVVGVRLSGLVGGYVDRSELIGGTCGDYLKPFLESQMVQGTLPLADLVLRMKDQRRVFVSILGSVGGIVSRSDLDKPPMRMWLFGIVTLIEMRFTDLIRMSAKTEEWKAFLSPSRFDKAKELYEERIRRNQELELLDCLQLSDKMQIIARNEHLRSMTQFESRSKMDAATKMLEKLRNNLAHAQDIISNDWETIVVLAENLERLFHEPRHSQDH